MRNSQETQASRTRHTCKTHTKSIISKIKTKCIFIPLAATIAFFTLHFQAIQIVNSHTLPNIQMVIQDNIILAGKIKSVLHNTNDDTGIFQIDPLENLSLQMTENLQNLLQHLKHHISWVWCKSTGNLIAQLDDILIFLLFRADFSPRITNI